VEITLNFNFLGPDWHRDRRQVSLHACQVRSNFFTQSIKQWCRRGQHDLSLFDAINTVNTAKTLHKLLTGGAYQKMHAGGTNIPVYQKKERKCTAARRISKDYGRQIRSDGLGPEQAVQSTVYFSTAPAAGRRSPIPWAGGARRQDWLALAESWVVLSLVIGVRELRKFLVLGGVTYLGGEGERGEKVYCTYIRSRSFTRLPHHVTLFTNPLRRTQDFSRSTIIFLVHFYGGGLICKRLVYVECRSTHT
jgi:hypothetical protein